MGRHVAEKRSRRRGVAVLVGLLIVAVSAIAFSDRDSASDGQELEASIPVKPQPDLEAGSTDRDRSNTGQAPSGQPSSEPPTPARVAREAPSQVSAERPVRLALPSRSLVPISSTYTGDNGELVLPADVNRAGWWDGSARLGDPFGAIVIAAHVDSFSQGLGVFAELLAVRPGETLHISSPGLNREFTVVRAELLPKATLSGDSPLYAASGEPRLVLITCGGAYDPARGGYQDNMVVVAVPKGPLEETAT
jgi:hypothetical protein